MKSPGFTLIELLVAVAITVILASLILTVTVGALGIWERAQLRTTTAMQGQLVLDQLERDLEGTIQQSAGQPWISLIMDEAPDNLTARGWTISDPAKIKPAGVSLSMLPPGAASTIADARFGVGGVWLRLIATNISSDGGRPVAISYQISRRPVGDANVVQNPGRARYLLMREEMGDQDSLNLLDGLFDSRTILQTPSTKSVLAVNVIDFGIWLYKREPSGELKPIFPVEANSPTIASFPTAGEVPTEADVMVRILSERGAMLIANMENSVSSMPAEFARRGGFSAWWWSVAAANSEVYVRRVRFINQPQ